MSVFQTGLRFRPSWFWYCPISSYGKN